MDEIKHAYDITGSHDIIKNGTIISHGDDASIQINVAGIHIVFRRIHDLKHDPGVVPSHQSSKVMVINLVNKFGEFSSKSPIPFAEIDGYNKDTKESEIFTLSINFVFKAFDNDPLSQFMIHYNIYAERVDGGR